MVSEDPVRADSFLRVSRRDALSRHTPLDCYFRSRAVSTKTDTPDFPAYSRLHSYRHRQEGQRFATLGRL